MLEFDPDGDGVVSPWEFKQALRNANVDIPDQQLNAIMRTMDLQVSLSLLFFFITLQPRVE